MPFFSQCHFSPTSFLLILSPQQPAVWTNTAATLMGRMQPGSKQTVEISAFSTISQYRACCSVVTQHAAVQPCNATTGRSGNELKSRHAEDSEAQSVWRGRHLGRRQRSSSLVSRRQPLERDQVEEAEGSVRARVQRAVQRVRSEPRRHARPPQRLRVHLRPGPDAAVEALKPSTLAASPASPARLLSTFRRTTAHHAAPPPRPRRWRRRGRGA